MSGTLLSFQKAAEAASAEVESGCPVHIETIRRWASKGVSGVILETTYRGGRRYVTREALDAFFQAIREVRTSQQRADRDTPPGYTAQNARAVNERKRRADEARERIRKQHGIG